MMRALLLGTWLCLLSTLLSGREGAPNFYLPDSKVESEKVKQEKRPVEESKSTSKKSDDPSNEAKPAKEPDKKPPDKSGDAETTLRKRKKDPDRQFEPKLDPFGLSRAFHHRWDFSSFLITEKEELSFRLEAARSRTLRLARAFSALSSEVEIRQRNLNSAALAAYLLSRDQHSWNPVTGRSLTEAQMLAVKTTMQQDIAAMQSALVDYETLRHSLNQSIEEVAQMEEKGMPDVAPAEPETTILPTVPTASLAHQKTESVLGERLFSVEALKATMAAESLSNIGDRRKSIASFAPPPPLGGKPQRPGTSLPKAPSEDVMKDQPRGESIKAPARTALVFETEVNAPVHAVRKGVVMYAGPFRGYGSMIIVEHEKGVFSVYSHLANIQVVERQPVSPGTILGRAGTPPELSRPGVHFQVRDSRRNLQPDEWLNGQAQRLLTGKQ